MATHEGVLIPAQTTVLVVAEDVRVCRRLMEVLEADGFEVLVESNGRKALRTLAARRVDLVMLDLHLSSPSGLRVLEEAVRANRELPVVVVATHCHVDTAREAMRLGARDYLGVPFEADLIRCAVRDVFHGPRPAAITAVAHA